MSVAPNETVLLHFSDGLRVWADAGARGAVVHGIAIRGASLVGAPYGSVWELGDGNITRVESGELTAKITMGDGGGGAGGDGESGGSGNSSDAECDGAAGEETRDNRDLVADGRAQPLDKEGVDALRASGVRGEALVRAIASASATFSGKTQFSREKYLRRKAGKHVRRFRVLRVTAAIAAVAMLESGRSGGLRADSLGSMLCAADVRAGATSLVFDGVAGLLLAGVLERCTPAGVDEALAGIAPTSFVLAAHDAAWNGPDLYAANRSNLGRDAAARAALVRISYSELNEWPAAVARVAARPAAPSGSPAAAGGGGGANKGGASKRPRPANHTPTSFATQLCARTLPIADAQLLLARGVDSVLIALPGVDVTALFLAAARYARPSGSFAVFSTDVAELGALAQIISDMKLGTQVSISETWTREIQVLPLRTHPLMAMHAVRRNIASSCERAETR